jgi:hypothetical protein
MIPFYFVAIERNAARTDNLCDALIVRASSYESRKQRRQTTAGQ